MSAAKSSLWRRFTDFLGITPTELELWNSYPQFYGYTGDKNPDVDAQIHASRGYQLVFMPDGSVRWKTIPRFSP